MPGESEICNSAMDQHWIIDSLRLFAANVVKLRGCDVVVCGVLVRCVFVCSAGPCGAAKDTGRSVKRNAKTVNMMKSLRTLNTLTEEHDEVRDCWKRGRW